MTKTISNFHVNAVQRTVVATLLGLSQDGELIKNLVSVDSNLVNNFF